MSGLFQIGTSALLSAQRALNTTSNNIANSATEGYSRQLVSFFEQQPTFIGSGYIGNGVGISDVRRAFDGYANDRVRDATASSAQQSQLLELGQQLDDLLAGDAGGLAPTLNRFFDALSDFATDPTDVPTRRAVLVEAEGLQLSFNTLGERFDEFRSLTTQLLQTTVNEINQRSTSIADLNNEIVAAGDTVPTRLLDQRDQEVRELAKLIGVTTNESRQGSLDVFTGAGQPLVLGAETLKVSLSDTDGDPARLSVRIGAAGGGTVDVTNRLSGGSLSGLIGFRDGVLTPAENTLGRIAVRAAEEFNRIQTSGVDLEGNVGRPLFSQLVNNKSVPVVFADTTNTGSARASISGVTGSSFPLLTDSSGALTDVMSAAVVDPEALDGSTYEVSVSASFEDDSGTWTLTDTPVYTIRRDTDGAIFNIQFDAVAGSYTVTDAGGVTINPPELQINDNELDGIPETITISGVQLSGLGIGELITEPDTAADGSQPDFTVPAQTITVAPVADTLTTSDFRVDVLDNGAGGVEYRVTRLSDGVRLSSDDITVISDLTDLSAQPDGTDIILFAGLELSTTQAVAGDRFTISPFRDAAALFDVTLAESSELAGAYPIRAVTPASNLGDGMLSNLRIQPGASGSFGDDLPIDNGLITLSYDLATNTFSSSAGTLTAPFGAYDPEADNRFVLELDDGSEISFELTGIPKDGDEFRILDGASGDNTNASRFEDLRFEDVVGGTANLTSAYGELVADVGTRVRQAEIASEAQAARLSAAESTRQSIVGVNLEEEAANLLRLQQAFEAATRVIVVANQTFQSVLAAVAA